MAFDTPKESPFIYLPAGASGVGTSLIHLCKSLIKECKIITSCSTSKINIAKEAGADLVLDYKKM